MTATVTHKKNPAVAWDVSASATAGTGESIDRVELYVNGSLRHSENFNPPTGNWSKTLTQQGQYPGDNKAELRVTYNKNKTTSAIDEWS